jgi:multiple sugar transport system ATP-binding protein
MSTSVELRRVVKKFGAHEIIRGVDLTIAPGEFTVFVGPSGCGKSTLLRLIAGLEKITSGDLVVDGERVNDVSASKRGIAMVFQSYALYPHMTVYKNLAFGLESTGYKRAEIDERVRHASDILQIEPLLKRLPRALSGGQRQRVAIGRAIVRDPKIFLFDEPLSNLDAELRVQMRVEISKLHQRLGNTMIYVTHDQVEAMTMATQIVVLRDGTVMQVGSPLDLYNRPANMFVAGFIGSPKMNFLPAKLSAATNGVRVGGNAIPLDLAIPATDDEKSVTLGIRPEHILLGGDAGALLCEAKVHLVEHLGGSTVVYVTTQDGNGLVAMVPGQVPVRLGETIPMRIDPQLCHLFQGDGTSLRSAGAMPAFAVKAASMTSDGIVPAPPPPRSRFRS